jgi:hypothetical protein
MNKIPTAKEFLNRGLDDSGFELTGAQLKIIARNAIEFAKLHVEAALESAYVNSRIDNNHQQGMTMDSDDFIINADSILNAYSLDNIK